MRIVQVLVIEDDRDARSNVEILRSDGFEVLETVDGESGVKSALTHLVSVMNHSRWLRG